MFQIGHYIETEVVEPGHRACLVNIVMNSTVGEGGGGGNRNTGKVNLRYVS